MHVQKILAGIVSRLNISSRLYVLQHDYLYTYIYIYIQLKLGKLDCMIMITGLQNGDR